ncbi:hypothetical protein [Alkaliphilus sp. B6464]|uniref:hypothetical protein n=1 Tax=Alkaliphilus sp. B6464 TaxID=2731219 RepID=UPI001BAD707A|nr:hypothetical protein [Alkaliphilus sp. B6464]QUH21897.1 hypothetical protein HYG84_18345 [Alkaliphilus sp. B6464]
MAGATYKLIHKYRAWSHFDKEILSTGDLDAVVGKYIDSVKDTFCTMDGPEPSIQVYLDNKKVGEFEKSSINKDFIIDEIKKMIFLLSSK